ncbi:unnamed protein product [Symbiodinium sp. CCMP2456]|nr:unnamed protein product [Symbiodinium sp. CCMP2456]
MGSRQRDVSLWGNARACTKTVPSFETAPLLTVAQKVAEVVLDALAAAAAQAIEAPAHETTFRHLHGGRPPEKTRHASWFDQSLVMPGAEEPKAEVPFRQLPSIATWLSATTLRNKRGEKADNETLCPSVPCLDAWLQRRPPS